MKTANKFTSLLRDCVPSKRWQPGLYPVLIYGAGGTGRKVRAYLKERGAEVAGFLDAQAQPGQCIDGIPVSTLSDWLSRNDPSRHEVFIAIVNPLFLPQIPELHQQISACVFAQCTWHPFTLSYITMSDTLPFHFENTRQCYEHFLPELTRLNDIFPDEKSRQCLKDYVRANCQEKAVQDYSAKDQYRPTDLPAWPQPLRFIDGGAFIGDTLADFRQHGYCFEAIAAFEPDPENFQRLILNTTPCENLTRFPCALGDKTKVVHFNAAASGGSHICEGGGRESSLPETTIPVQCVSLDEVLPDFRPNLIKMDIEGAEPEALMGAKNMIARHRPHLAICLYHRLDHLWRIPLMIHEWNLGYRFHMRQHEPISDLVLYAYPNKE